MAFIVNWAQNKASEYLKTGIQAGGTLAGDAVGGVGSLIENSGRTFGQGTVNGGIRGVGTYINNYGEAVKGSMAADGPVGAAKKVAVKPGEKKGALPAQRALPSSSSAAAPAQKSLPAPSPKKTAGARPVAKTSAANPPPPVAQKAANGKVRINPASRPKPNSVAATPTTRATSTPAKPHAASNPLPGGKRQILAASGPKPGVKI